MCIRDRLYDRVQHAQKNTTSLFGSLAWIIDRSSVLQTGIQVNSEHGFLSDPYKLVTVGVGTIHDLRPGQRDQMAWLVRYRRAFSGPDAALHLDFRYAQDNWGVTSQTLEAAWYQPLPARWQLVPGLRYYSQQEARFYAPFFRDPSAVSYTHLTLPTSDLV